MTLSIAISRFLYTCRTEKSERQSVRYAPGGVGDADVRAGGDAECGGLLRRLQVGRLALVLAQLRGSRALLQPFTRLRLQVPTFSVYTLTSLLPCECRLCSTLMLLEISSPGATKVVWQDTNSRWPTSAARKSSLKEASTLARYGRRRSSLQLARFSGLGCKHACTPPRCLFSYCLQYGT